MLRTKSLCHFFFVSLIVLPSESNARLLYMGKNVASQTVKVAQGSRVLVTCRGSTPTWAKGREMIETSGPSAAVIQTKGNDFSILFIKSLTPATVGAYSCQITRNNVETVTFGELQKKTILFFKIY